MTRKTLPAVFAAAALAAVLPAAGANTITFGNSSTGYAPNIDRIQIAAPIG